MPTYDYKCKGCDHTWEEFQSIKAPATKKCPSCGKSKAERQIGGGGGLIFRGSGFYITDYRSDSYKKSAEADKPASSSSESKSETKSSGESKSKGASKSD